MILDSVRGCPQQVPQLGATTATAHRRKLALELVRCGRCGTNYRKWEGGPYYCFPKNARAPHLLSVPLHMQLVVAGGFVTFLGGVSFLALFACLSLPEPA